MVSSTARWHSAALRTSVRRKIALPPASRIAAVTAWPRVSLRPVMATAAPSRANRSAVASPMPEVPPVMRATWLWRRMDWDRILRSQSARALCHFGGDYRLTVRHLSSELLEPDYGVCHESWATPAKSRFLHSARNDKLIGGWCSEGSRAALDWTDGGRLSPTRAAAGTGTGEWRTGIFLCLQGRRPRTKRIHPSLMGSMPWVGSVRRNDAEMGRVGHSGARGAAGNWDYGDHRMAAVSRAEDASADSEKIRSHATKTRAGTLHRYGAQRVHLLPLPA